MVANVNHLLASWQQEQQGHVVLCTSPKKRKGILASISMLDMDFFTQLPSCQMKPLFRLSLPFSVKHQQRPTDRYTQRCDFKPTQAAAENNHHIHCLGSSRFSQSTSCSLLLSLQGASSSCPNFYLILYVGIQLSLMLNFISALTLLSCLGKYAHIQLSLPQHVVICLFTYL